MIGLLFPVGVFAALLLVWLFFRSRGYKRQPLDSPPGSDWSLTDESFIDPQSGATLEVWYCPKNGERAYVRRRSGRAP